jgi:hypothetical protein
MATPRQRHAYDRPIWFIKTPLGDALRGEWEVKVVGGHECLEPEPSLIVPAHVPKEKYNVIMFTDDDMPPANGTTAIRNICGFVSEYAVMANHPAWRCRRSTLGKFNEAYTLRGGNVIFLRGKAIFKGGVSYEGVKHTMGKLLASPAVIGLKTYLIVATAHLGRNVCVNQGCLIENMLEKHFPWCKVMRRHEELSNAIIFYIHDWKKLDVPKQMAPDLGTVSISRRGVINARFTWHDGVEWTGNDVWIRLTDSVKEFIKQLC